MTLYILKRLTIGLATLVVASIVVFFVLRRRQFRAPTAIALILGVVLAALTNTIHTEAFSLSLATPEWTPPVFTVSALFGLALPMFILSLTSQNAPGQAVLRAERRRGRSAKEL